MCLFFLYNNDIGKLPENENSRVTSNFLYWADSNILLIHKLPFTKEFIYTREVSNKKFVGKELPEVSFA